MGTMRVGQDKTHRKVGGGVECVRAVGDGRRRAVPSAAVRWLWGVSTGRRDGEWHVSGGHTSSTMTPS